MLPCDCAADEKANVLPGDAASESLGKTSAFFYSLIFTPVLGAHFPYSIWALLPTKGGPWTRLLSSEGPWGWGASGVLPGADTVGPRSPPLGGRI